MDSPYAELVMFVGAVLAIVGILIMLAAFV